MANVTGDNEKTVRDSITSYIEGLGMNLHVFDRRVYIASLSDFVALTGKEVSGDDVEVRYIFIEFLNFVDDPFQGLGDCPAINISYRLHVFIQYADTRPDNSNSERDFMNTVLLLRDAFLVNSNFAYDSENTPLVDDVFAGFGSDAETGVQGHSKDLVFSVNINPDNIP